MSDEEKTVGVTSHPKVVSLFGGRPISESAAPSADAPAATGPVIDQDAIKYLEDLMERFKAGELTGFALVVGQADEDGEPMDVETWVSNKAFDHDLHFLGGVVILQDHLKGIRVPNPLAFSEDDDG